MLRTSSRDAAPARRESSIRVIMDALRRIVRDLRLSARGAEGRAGISSAQLFVLQALADARAASLNDLAARTLTDQSSVSVVVRRLADKKLVARRPSAQDARRVELSLTPAGRRMLARCPEPTQVRLVEALKRMSALELAALTQGLTALGREMGPTGTPAPMFFEHESSPAERRGGQALRDEPRRSRDP